MTTEQTQALIGMTVVLVILVLLTLPSLLGMARDRRIDREIRAARGAREDRRGGRHVPERRQRRLPRGDDLARGAQRPAGLPGAR